MKGVWHMEELLSDILYELKNINKKLDNIKGDGLWNSITDIHNDLENIQASIDRLD